MAFLPFGGASCAPLEGLFYPQVGWEEKQRVLVYPLLYFSF
jgi:hypothetical protein